jgi:hypothetical protein
MIWIAMRDANAIGRFDPSTEEMRHFVLPTPNARPCGVTVDAKGTVWFSERNGGKIGRIGKDGTIHEACCHVSPGRSSWPRIIAGDLVLRAFAGRIGRFDPATSTPITTRCRATSRILRNRRRSKGNVGRADIEHDRVIVRTDLAYLANERSGQHALAATQAGYDLHTLDADAQSTPGTPRSTVTGRCGSADGRRLQLGSLPAPGSKVGFIRNGRVGELATPTPQSGPTSMAKDPCGDDIWITLRGEQDRGFATIGSSGDVPVPDSEPVGIAVDFNHNVGLR